MRSASAIRENGVPRRPKCPLHVCVEMVLIEEAAPGWVQAAQDAEEVIIKLKPGQHHKRWKRKSWKCPAPGCFRVAAYAPAGEEEKKLSVRKCRKCGAPSDQPGDLRVTGRGSLCRNCCREKEHARVARLATKAARSHKGPREHYEPADLPGEHPLAAAVQAVHLAETLLDRWRDLPSASEAIQ